MRQERGKSGTRERRAIIGGWKMKWIKVKNWKGILLDKCIYAVVWLALSVCGITLFLKLMDYYWKWKLQDEARVL